MAGLHEVLPDAAWLLNLVLSAGIGTVVYAAVVFAIGLAPGERDSALRLVGKLTGRKRAAA